MGAAKKKPLTPEKAAAEISNMLLEGTAESAEDAVKQRPELKPGLTQYDGKKPASKGSGPPVIDRDAW